MQYPNKEIHNALKEDQLRIFYKRMFEVLQQLDQLYINVKQESVETYTVNNRFPLDYRVFFQEYGGLSISASTEKFFMEASIPISNLMNDFEGAETRLFRFPGHDWENKEDDFYCEKEALQFKDILVFGWSDIGARECYCFDKRYTPHLYFSEGNEHGEGGLYRETFLDRLLEDVNYVLDEELPFDAKPAWEYIYNGNLEELNSYRNIIRYHFLQKKIEDFFSSKLRTSKNGWVLKFAERRAVLDVIEHFTQNKRGKLPETRKSLEIIKAIDVSDLLIFKENIKKWELFHTISEGNEKKKIYTNNFSFFLIATENGVDISIRIISDDTAKDLKDTVKKN